MDRALFKSHKRQEQMYSISQFEDRHVTGCPALQNGSSGSFMTLQQTACLVVNQITVGNFAFPCNCTPVGWTSDSITVPT